jgi:hypothetical protein
VATLSRPITNNHDHGELETMFFNEFQKTCHLSRLVSTLLLQFSAHRVPHGSGDPCGLAARAWVGRFPPARNPHLQARVSRQAWVFSQTSFFAAAATVNESGILRAKNCCLSAPGGPRPPFFGPSSVQFVPPLPFTNSQFSKWRCKSRQASFLPLHAVSSRSTTNQQGLLQSTKRVTLCHFNQQTRCITSYFDSPHPL